MGFRVDLSFTLRMKQGKKGTVNEPNDGEFSRCPWGELSRGNRLIFDDISLTVPHGKITAIMGPSGIGKTTLLRLIGGQIPPDSGEILFDGENVPEMSRSRLYTVRKRMSMLFSRGLVHRHERL